MTLLSARGADPESQVEYLRSVLTLYPYVVRFTLWQFREA
jgi:hypothetical protein